MERFNPYAAGLVDTDSSIAIGYQTVATLRIAFHRDRLESLDAIAARYRASVTPRGAGRTLSLATRAALLLLVDVLPFLRGRHRHAQRILGAFSTKMSAAQVRELRDELKTYEEPPVAWDTPTRGGRRFDFAPSTTVRCQLCETRASARGLCRLHYAEAARADELPAVWKVPPRRPRVPSPFDHLRPVTVDDHAYTAGVIDSAARFEVARRRLCLRIARSVTAPLVHLRGIYGGTLRPQGRRVLYTLTAQQAIRQLLDDAHPYLRDMRVLASQLRCWSSWFTDEEWASFEATVRAAR